MVIGPLLGAGTSLAQALMGMGAQQDATNLGYMNLFETRRTNRRQEAEQRRINDLIEQLQKAARGDALGNVIRFDEDLNEFITDITPMTRSILAGQQNELLRQLTQDAPRNREATERMDRRSRMADEEFERVFNEYRFRPRSSEAAEIGDATRETLSARKKGINEASGLLAQQLLRTGATSNIDNVAEQMGRTHSDSLQDAILTGKREGRARHQQAEGSDVARFLQELGALSQLAGTTTTSPVGRSDVSEQLAGRSDQALQQLVSALMGGGQALTSIIGQGAGRTQQAMQALMQTVAGGAPNLSGVASALSKLSMPQQRDVSQPVNDPWFGLRQLGIGTP